MKNKVKKLLSLVLAAVTVFSLSTVAFAATPGKVTKVSTYNIDDEINLKWNTVKNADGYSVYIHDGNKWRGYSSTKRLYMEVDDLQSAKVYKFKVRAYYKYDGKYYYGDFSDVYKVKTTAAPSAKSSSASSSVITESKAIQIALGHVGVKRADVRGFECELDNEKGVKVYEVSFDHGKYEYDYDIDAVSGKILRSTKERD